MKPLSLALAGSLALGASLHAASIIATLDVTPEPGFNSIDLNFSISPNTWGFASPPNQFDYLQVNGRLLAGNSNTSPEEFRAMMEFDLSTTPSALLTDPIYLNLQTGRTGNPLSFQLYGYIADGVIDRSDYSAGSSLLSDFTLSSPQLLSFDVTSFVRSNFDSNNMLLGFNIRPTVSGGFPQDTTWGFDAVSLTDVSTGVPPDLPPDIPEPSSLILSLLGTVGLATRRRRRRNA